MPTGRQGVRLIGHGPAIVGEQRTAARTFAGLIDIAYSHDRSGLRPPALARLWDAPTGHELLALRGHQAPLNAVAFAADGARLATAMVSSAFIDCG